MVSCHQTARRGEQLFAGVNGTLHVALERSTVESPNSVTCETCLEQSFREPDAFSADSEEVSVPSWNNTSATDAFAANTENVSVPG